VLVEGQGGPACGQSAHHWMNWSIPWATPCEP
jgi:hypothetical protein